MGSDVLGRAFSLPFWQASKFNLHYATELGETGGENKVCQGGVKNKEVRIEK
jgi:hypothetical protein